MTARELGILARYLIYTYPEYYPFFGEKSFTFNKHTFNNRNPLIFAPELGVDGLKTGFIEEAGYGLVASAKRGDQRLILVVNGLNSKQEREGEPRKLIEWGFKSFKPFRLFDQGREGERRAGLGRHRSITCRWSATAISTSSCPPPRAARSRRRSSIRGRSRRRSRRATRVAVLRITSAESSATNEIPLYAGDDIDQSNFAMRGLDSLLVLAFGWLL